MRSVIFVALIGVGLGAAFGARAEPATARYAPAQLEVAQELSDSAAVRVPAARIYEEANRIAHDAAQR